MRITGLIMLSLTLLAACAPSVPDGRATGVGFAQPGDRVAGQSGGEPVLQGPFVPGGRVSDELAQSGDTLDGLGASTGGGQPTSALADTDPATTTGARAAPVIDTNNPGISDEQDFSAVSARESMESDAERLAAQRDAFVEIQPGALPTRRGAAEPSIVEYALSTNHGLGVATYARSSLAKGARFDRNCGKYASPDLAQTAFLKAGGPTRDRMGIDPDGDGYACYWDPTPFRAAMAQ